MFREEAQPERQVQNAYVISSVVASAILSKRVQVTVICETPRILETGQGHRNDTSSWQALVSGTRTSLCVVDVVTSLEPAPMKVAAENRQTDIVHRQA